MFLATFDVSERKIRSLLDKQRRSAASVCPDDGRSGNRSRLETSEESKETVRRHIRQFPAYTSHYAREKSKKKYLSSDLNIKKMHDLYGTWCAAENVEPVKEHIYRHIFTEDFNLSFRKPHTDTCNRCDQFKILIKNAANDDVKQDLERQKNSHQEWATKMYKMKDKDKTAAKTFPNIRTMSFDLQKCLPTPFLTSGESYYKRQLYTLNLTTYTTVSNEQTKATCYLWHEGIAKRGSQEIGSCLYKELQMLPLDVDTLFCYSDCCRGQNVNFFICCMFSYFIEECFLKGREMTIIHRLLVPGHTHMEADTIHGAIEKAKKATSIDIQIPKDWAQLIANVRRKNPIQIVEMDLGDFLAFKSLDNTFYKRPKQNVNHMPIRFSDIVCFKYTSGAPGAFFYKYKESTAYEKMFIKEQKSEALPVLQPISTEPLTLLIEKLRDLQDLQKFINPVNRAFYETFLSKLQPKKKGRKPKVTNVIDHFEADLSDFEVSENEN